MLSNLFEKIQDHLSMLDLALASSEKITNYAQSENLDAVILETENRERLVNIVRGIQQKIENQINQLNAAEVTGEDILILNSWFQDLSLWSEKMIAYDKKTVDLLGQQKNDTTKEIAHLFKNKEMFKGYNATAKK
jgi:hypothetical protein